MFRVYKQVHIEVPALFVEVKALAPHSIVAGTGSTTCTRAVERCGIFYSAPA